VIAGDAKPYLATIEYNKDGYSEPALKFVSDTELFAIAKETRLYRCSPTQPEVWELVYSSKMDIESLYILPPSFSPDKSQQVLLLGM